MPIICFKAGVVNSFALLHGILKLNRPTSAVDFFGLKSITSPYVKSTIIKGMLTLN